MDFEEEILPLMIGRIAEDETQLDLCDDGCA
jgi:hypothetical protein